MPFTDNVFLYVIVFFTCYLLLNGVAKKSISTNITIDDSNVLRGWFIIGVVLHHFCQRLIEPGFLKVYYEMGYLAVGMFFFLSGYGLNARKEGKNEGVFSFLRIKITRVYIPCVIVNVVLFFFFNFNSVFSVILEPTGIDNTQWFISAILFFYFIYYISKMVYSGNLFFICFCVLLYVICCLFFDLGSWWYISSFCFPLGFFWHKYNVRIQVFVSKISLLSLTMLVVVTCIFLYLKRQYEILGFISCPLFCLNIMVFLSKYEVRSKTMSYIGQCSLEIYILHMKLMWILQYYMNKSVTYSSFLVLPYFLVLIISAFVFFRINNIVMRKLKP